MVRTVFATFNSRNEAEKAINELKENFFDNEPSFIIRDNQQHINSENCSMSSDKQNNEGDQFQPMFNQGSNPMSSFGSFNQLASQSLNNGYLAGSTIGGLFGLAASAGAVATIGVPLALAGALSSMSSLPMTMQMNNPMSSPSTLNNTYQDPSSTQSQPAQNGVMVTIQTPEEKLWQTANFLKEHNAVEVRTS